MKIIYSKTGIMSVEGESTDEEVTSLAAVLNNHAEYLKQLQEQKFNELIGAEKTDIVNDAVKTLKIYCKTHECLECRFKHDGTGKCKLNECLPCGWKEK